MTDDTPADPPEAEWEVATRGAGEADQAEPAYPGNQADQDVRSAIAVVADMARLLITIATGAVVLSATFLEKFYAGESLELLEASWVVFGFCILMGYVSLGEVTRQYDESDLQVRRGPLEAYGFLQLLAFLGGGALFAFFVAANLSANPVVDVEFGAAHVAAHKLRIPVDCSSRTPCTGTTRTVLKVRGRTRAHAVQAFAAGGDGLATIAVPLTRATLHRHPQAEVTVTARDRTGRSTVTVASGRVSTSTRP
ncbi:MAG TPA: hypothetical protein VJT75_00910 [Thermoleophilaceae bacterium]|nr:hypothetical protein [Thermoleophilaceae bacterium]